MATIIKRNHIGAKLPASNTVILILCSKVWEWSDLTNGIVFSLVGVLWILSIYSIATEKDKKLKESCFEDD